MKGKQEVVSCVWIHFSRTIFKPFQNTYICTEQCKTKTELLGCSQRKHLSIASCLNHCSTCWAVDVKCDMKRFTHHYIAQHTLVFHCFPSVLLWVFRKLIFKMCNRVFSHLISKTDWNWFIFKLAEKNGQSWGLSTTKESCVLWCVRAHTRIADILICF